MSAEVFPVFANQDLQQMQIPIKSKFASGIDARAELNDQLVELVRETREGNSKASNTLCTLLFEKYYGVARQKVDRNPDDAMELMQTAFLHFLQAIQPEGSFQFGRGDNVLAYFAAILDRVALRFIQIRAIQNSVVISPDEDDLQNLPSVHSIANSGRWRLRKARNSGRSQEFRDPVEVRDWSNYIAERIDDALRFVDDRDKTIFDLRYGEGLTLEEIGEDSRVGVTIERVRFLHNRMIRRIRKVLLSDREIKKYHDEVLEGKYVSDFKFYHDEWGSADSENSVDIETSVE